MVSKKAALVSVCFLALVITVGAYYATAEPEPASEWEDYEIRITVPQPGTSVLSEGGSLYIEGTLTYQGNPVEWHPNAACIKANGVVVGTGMTNIYQGHWHGYIEWSVIMSQLGEGVWEYVGIWYGDGWGVSTWMSQGHNVFFVDVRPSVVTYELTTHVDPAGSGSVTPPSGTYNEGTSVNVVATPTPGSDYSFSHWSGDASGTNDHIVITMDDDKDITAHFTAAPPTYTLTTHVDPSGAGTVSPPGGTYPQGTVLSVSANANTGYVFDHWSGDASGTSQTIELIMNSNKDITAHFELEDGGEYWNLTTYVAEGNGTVDPAGTNTYADGEQVTITATPDTRWTFDHWSGDLSGSQNPAIVTMTSHKTVAAHFAPDLPDEVTLTMISTPPSGGTIQATLAQVTQATFPVGSTVYITAFPNEGWQFDYWSGDLLGDSPTTAITMDTDKIAIAVFSQEEEPWWQVYQLEIIVVVAIAIVLIAAGVVWSRKGG